MINFSIHKHQSHNNLTVGEFHATLVVIRTYGSHSMIYHSVCNKITNSDFSQTSFISKHNYNCKNQILITQMNDIDILLFILG